MCSARSDRSWEEHNSVTLGVCVSRHACLLPTDLTPQTGVSESESDSDVELQLRERTGSGWAAGNGVFKREGVGRLELSVDGDSEISVGICLSFTPGAFFQG